MKIMSVVFAVATLVGVAAQAQNHFGGRNENRGPQGPQMEDRQDFGRGPGYGPGYGRGPGWGRGPGHGGPGYGGPGYGRPRPPMPPPPPRYNPCQGTIQGTWGYKGGRPMTLQIIHQGYEYVTVNVSTERGGESVSGYCRVTGYGDSANIEFSGGINNGNISIDGAGRVQGVVSGFSFVGQRY